MHVYHAFVLQESVRCLRGFNALPVFGPFSKHLHQVSPLPPKLDRSGPRFDVFCFFCSCCVDILLLPSLLFVASGNTSPY